MSERSFTIEPMLDRVAKEVGDRSDVVMLAFVSEGCSICSSVLEEADRLHKNRNDSIIVICPGDSKEAEDLARLHQLSVPTLPDVTGVLHKRFGVSSHPTLVVVARHDLEP